MSTPFTGTRLVRYWFSCFRACRFLVRREEKPKRCCCSSTVICYCKNHGRESEDENGQEPIKEEGKSDDLEFEVNEDEDEELRWPSFEEEDYIVFCFEEDGDIHMMKEVKSEPSIRVHRSKASTSSLSVSRKLDYGENVIEIEPDPIEEQKDTYRTNDDLNFVKKGKKIAGNNSKKKYVGNDSGESEWKDASSELSDSSVQSDSTSGSFAFPAVSWEWMGSPVKMPSSEGMRFTKRNPSHCVRLHCCRFRNSF